MRVRAKFGFQLERLPILLDALIHMSRVVGDHPGVFIDDEREWINLLRPHLLRDRFRVPPHGGQIEGVPVMRECIVWIKLDCLFELLLGARPVPIVKRCDVSQRGLSFSERVVYFQRLRRRRLRPRHCFARR